MKRFLKKFLLFLLCIVALDFLVGLCGKFLLTRLSDGNYSNKEAMTVYNIMAATPDIAIIGSSPALNAYIPQILKDSLKVATAKDYDIRNTACYVQGMPYFKAELLSLISRKVPDVVILDMSPHYLEDFNDIPGVIEGYYNYNPYIKALLDEKYGFWDRMKLKSSMYSLNGKLLQFINAFRTPKGADGYWPNQDNLKIIPHDTKTETILYGPNVRLFEEIISIAKDNDIHLIVVTAPSNVKYTDECSAYKKIVEECNNNGLTYLDFSRNPLFEDDSLFADDAHLKDNGAQFFTKEFYRIAKDEILSALQ